MSKMAAMPLTTSQKIVSSSSGLFGKEDPQFLEALAELDVDALIQRPILSVQKEPTSSSDLFGTDDPTFLDALSKEPLPGDVFQFSGVPSHGKPAPTNVALRGCGDNQSRKRPHSPEKSPSYSHVISSPENDSRGESSYTDSNIYGPSKFHGFGEYMHRKRAKLNIQNIEMEESSGGSKSTLFKGLALHINGKTHPSVQELRKLIVQHGGIFHPYLDRKKMVTHIIASNLTPSKVLEFKNMKVATPTWLLESIKARTLLPWRNFAIGAGNRPDESQGKIKATQDTIKEHVVQEKAHSSLTTPKQVSVATPNDSKHAVTPPTGNASPSKGTNSFRPLYTTDPVTMAEANRVPSYAAHKSNPHAKRKIEDPDWRAANTAVAPGFVEEYYKNSRLHHLSMWKSELQDLVAKAAERIESGEEIEFANISSGIVPEEERISGIHFHKSTSPKKGKGKEPETHVIMHCDFDSFFVSAGLVNRPHLKGKPVVVCHSQGDQGGASSTSEIASSSYEARKFGIRNGMSLGQAKKLCANIHTIPYEFELYKRFSLQFYTILMSYADDLQAVSVDEALVDVTSTVENARVAYHNSIATRDFAKELADIIRARVKHVTGCEVSIGISHNILLARVATRRAKPAGSFHLLPRDAPEILSPLDIGDVRGFGWSTRSKVEAKFGVTTLGELAKRPKGALCDALGKKTGETLWNAIRGIDDTKLESDRVRKSVSSEINYAIRFNNNDEAEKFVREMAVEVSKRLVHIGMCGRSLTLKVMTRDPKAPVEAPKFLGHGICDTTNKTAPLLGPGGRATADEAVISECAWRLLKGMHFDPKELRGIGIHVQKLERIANTGQGSPEQAVLPFHKKTQNLTLDTPQRDEPSHPVVVVDPPSQDVIVEDDSSSQSDRNLTPASMSQIDPSFLSALPADIVAELQQEYARADSGQPIAGPSKHPDALLEVSPPRVRTVDEKPRTDLARITKQLAPKSRPSISPTKGMHPLFEKRKSPVALKVSAAELKLLNIDPEVWDSLPIELQREQLATSRAANVGTGMAIRASMSTQAKQQRILSRWRMKRRSPSVGIRGHRPEILARHLDLPGLKQRGKNKGTELKVSETEDVQVIIGQWVLNFEEHSPRKGDVEYLGKFLERCTETDVGLERAVSALKWWRVLLRQRWASLECCRDADSQKEDSEMLRVGQNWWSAFWEVKTRMDRVMKKRFGGHLSLR